MTDSNRINLVVFIREYPIGMAGTKRVQHFLDFLHSKGISINVIAFRSKIPQPGKSGIYKSIPYVCIGSGTKGMLINLPKIFMYYIKGFSVILKFKRKSHTNIIYCSGGIDIENLLFIWWSKILKFKIVLAIEEDYSFFKDNIKSISKFKFKTVKRFDFLNCRWADSIIVVSTYLLDKYVKLKARKVTLIPISAKPNFDKSKKSFNIPLQVIYAGTFTDKDGVSDIIDGFLRFNRKYGNSILILTGKSEQQLFYMEKYKEERNLLFKGYVEDSEFYSLLKNADVLCMCRTESGFANAGFPFKLGEYLATGNPVICTKVSDVEYYLNDEDAFLIDPESPDQISDSLEHIISDPEGSRRKGQKGLMKCIKYFLKRQSEKFCL